MRYSSITLGLAVLACASPLLAIGPRYSLPEAVRITLSMDADASPGVFALTGRVQALAGGVRNALVTFRLPPEVEPLGRIPRKKGDLARGKDVSLKVKVRLRPEAKQAIVGFGVSYDFPAEAWLKYVWQHRKTAYRDMHLRDHLEREIKSRAGQPAAVSRIAVLTRGSRSR